jgi:DNA-directed RNA polymerase subunit RPC12/RpoP
MKILIVPNLLFQYIKLDDVDEEDSKQKIECIRCGFNMGEYTLCHLKCFKCGSEFPSLE